LPFKIINKIEKKVTKEDLHNSIFVKWYDIFNRVSEDYLEPKKINYLNLQKKSLCIIYIH